ncbi:FUSC family protein [Micromonospora globispora]|uniref:FUSC family protein n=1 Tax=Micromonospora globispora TaxID=1450148 RepID=A0A317KHZ3_9ACTN|nr:FUSC family protein [Micromonospora globispora]PWU51368.1 FUSC family protein [Micromonospora globispora]RQW82004.1 FUSC family protein [Micromonospora globispora]
MGVLDWLRRRDPSYQAIRRAARLTLVCSLNFYGCRYGLGNTILATYALFGSVATGLFAQLPGPAGRRARTLLTALPAAWVLIALGTVLAVSTWAAAAGMLVVGFAVAFAGVGGPGPRGLANAFQLFYILACFPPYDPGTLPARLVGVTLGIVLLAAAEVALWPDPAPVRYQQRVADAAESVARFVDGKADVLAGEAGADTELVRRRDRAFRAMERVRLVHLAPTQRPTSAGARDRALRECAAALRQVLALAHRLPIEPGAGEADHVDVARRLHQCAATTRAAGRTVLAESPAVGIDELHAASARLDERLTRRGTAALPRAPDVAHLRLDAMAQVMVEQVRTFATAARIAAGFPIRADEAHPGEGPDLFWYARQSALSLFWQRFRVHLTPSSVYFQAALRIAVALAAARVIAGSLNLQHGFWVLLATLTLMRTSAADTRTTLRPVLVGTFAGAAVGGLLLVVTPGPAVYVPLLPIAMVLAFAAGPLLGLGWGQAMITVLLTLVFAQLAPANLQLARARVVDVVIGAGVGILAGLLFWPRGGSGQLRRDVAAYLEHGSIAVEETVEAMTGRKRPREGLDAARRAMVLADASFCQYHSESHHPGMSHVDWEAARAAGNHMVRGAESLLRDIPPGSLAVWPDAATSLASFTRWLRFAYADLATRVRAGRIARPVSTPSAPEDVLGHVQAIINAGEHRREVLRPVEVEVWLAGLSSDLERIKAPADQPAQRATR